MANQFDGIFDQEFKDTFNDGIDALIDAFELPCRIHYISTKFIPCTACANSNRGRKGPNPFIGGGGGTHTGTCSVCGGDSKVEVPNNEGIKLIVIWEYRDFTDIASGIKHKEGQVQTFCRIDNVGKLVNADYITFNTDIEQLINNKYRMAGRPVPCGLGKDSYLITNWDRS